MRCDWCEAIIPSLKPVVSRKCYQHLTLACLVWLEAMDIGAPDESLSLYLQTLLKFNSTEVQMLRIGERYTGV